SPDPVGKPGDACCSSALTHTETNEDGDENGEQEQYKAVAYVDVYTKIQWAEGIDTRDSEKDTGKHTRTDGVLE
ncbi:hypothetical protein JOB18_003485, partial [Solea senegalensis]